MAYQINKLLNDKSGLTAASGTYVRQIVQFKENGTEIEVKLNCYPTKALCEAGKGKYEPEELGSLNGAFSIKFDEEVSEGVPLFSVEDLTAIAAAKAIIQEKIKSKLVALEAIGNVVEIVA